MKFPFINIIQSKPKRGRPKKTPKTLKQILSDALTTEIKKDPALKRELAMREGGYGDLLDKDKETESNKREIKRYITTQALKQIKEDPELASQFVEDNVSEIMGTGKPSRRRRNNDDDIPLYGGGDGMSSISSALEEIESLSALKEKLVEMGMVSADGNGAGGFLKGINLADILTALPHIAMLMGKGNVTPVRTYVVNVNGKMVELPEDQYQLMLQQGTVKPLELEVPKTEEPNKNPELPEWLNDVDFVQVEQWLNISPEDFVKNVKKEVTGGSEQANFIWNLLSNATYEKLVEKITPYKNNSKVGNLVEKLLSDEGKDWFNRVVELRKSDK